jgi:hypothetical protein
MDDIVYECDQLVRYSYKYWNLSERAARVSKRYDLSAIADLYMRMIRDERVTDV